MDLNGNILQALQPQSPTLNVAQPLNDVQLVCLVACHIDAPTVADRVEAALDLVAETVAAMDGGQELVRRIKAKQALRGE